jgi:hypothetical protein
MATCASQVFDSGPSDASGKVCKRCNSKVLNAFTKCAKCDEYYHTSCIKILLDRGKKFCVITESVMLCEEHCREIHNIEEAFHKVLKKVNYQNSKLKETVEEMKEEIHSLTAQLAETRQTLDAKSLVCGGFNHMSNNCQIKEILCLNCGKAGHTESECQNNTVCINCSKLNNINNINIKVNHSRFDYECEAYRRQVAVVRSQTVYEV